VRKTDKKRIEFHIESGDYFGTLATVLSLVRQSIDSGFRNGSAPNACAKVLKRLESDLLYLQNHYEIIERED